MAALKVYQGKGWTLIEDNLNYLLGQQYYNNGAYADALTRFMK